MDTPSKPPKKKQTPTYPTPLTIPSTGPHTQTLIFLHGRGSTSTTFSSPFLTSATSTSGKTLPAHFPGLKLIFPSAKKRRARWYNRAVVSQWFDGVPVEEQDGMGREQEEWQLEGLKESQAFLRGVVEAEVREVGARNVFIGGLSQGCAVGLWLLLSWQGGGDGDGDEIGVSGVVGIEPLGGFVGMSGWLPFAAGMEEVMHLGSEDGNAGGGDDDPFANSGDEDDGVGFVCGESALSVAARVCNLVRDNIDLPSIETEEPLCMRTPVFLGHGRNDEKVKIESGLQAAGILRNMGMQVTWREYDEGHWYKVPEEIDDIVEFLREGTDGSKS